MTYKAGMSIIKTWGMTIYNVCKQISMVTTYYCNVQFDIHIMNVENNNNSHAWVRGGVYFAK